MEEHGAEDAFRRMLVLDALILNTDRHAGNYGMMFDTDTLQILKMGPVFDHNQALLPYAEEEDFLHLEEYLATRPTRIGEDFNEIAYESAYSGNPFRFDSDERFSVPEKSKDRITGRAIKSFGRYDQSTDRSDPEAETAVPVKRQ